MKLKLDLHVHTDRSQDAHTRPDELIANIRRSGLDGLAITDHDLLATDTQDGALIIKGVEISSQNGHIIGLGISTPIPRGLPADETIRQIRQLGGISIVAHPYDIFRSAINPESLTIMPDAIEVVNSASMFHTITWKRARQFAEKNHLTQTAGSDSHIPETIGKAFTTIDCDENTPISVLTAIKNGFTIPSGIPYDLGDRIHKLVRHK